MSHDPQTLIDGETTCAICGGYAQWFTYPGQRTADVRCENDHAYEVDEEGEMIVRPVTPADPVPFKDGDPF